MLITAKRVTPPDVLKVVVPPDQRLISQPPTRHSNVFPTAIALQVVIEPAVVAFARKAPIRMAGEMRYPSSNTADTARPVAGQMGVTLGLIDASNKPALAQAK
jgi:hypothetical protein